MVEPSKEKTPEELAQEASDKLETQSLTSARTS